MKSIPSAIALTSLLLVSGPHLTAAGFFFEAGVGNAFLRDAYLPPQDAAQIIPASSGLLPNGEVVTTVFVEPSIDDSATVPFVAAGYSFSNHFDVRLSYTYFGTSTSEQSYLLVVGSGAVVGTVNSVYKDETHLVSLSPVFRWPVGRSLTLTFSPDLNWGYSELTIRSRLDEVVALANPSRETKSKLTLGGTVTAEWRFSAHTAAVIGYHYVDLDSAWGRTAHVASASLRWRL